MNLANKLTLFRIILVPFFLIFTYINTSTSIYIATAIFILASLTDKLDGYIARSRNQITDFGKFMDPLADKLLVLSALITLVDFHIIPAWIAVIIIGRELAVTGLRAIAANSKNVIAASNWGKAKTVTQMVAIIIAFININLNNSIINLLFIVMIILAVIVTIISGVDYFYKNKSLINTAK
ncbi:MAG: CDP-diacylglycerol--glycerol-3-phosphate 3-phosphatidyltransferase [Clostridiaceae bacterium]